MGRTKNLRKQCLSYRLSSQQEKATTKSMDTMVAVGNSDEEDGSRRAADAARDVANDCLRHLRRDSESRESFVTEKEPLDRPSSLQRTIGQTRFRWSGGYFVHFFLPRSFSASLAVCTNHRGCPTLVATRSGTIFGRNSEESIENKWPLQPPSHP